MLHVLIYTRTTNYPHESIPDGVRAITDLGLENHFDVTESNDPAIFHDTALASFDVVTFLNNSGNILDAGGRLALQRFVHSGRGIVGIHGAAATLENWPWYVGLIGATFKNHPDIQTATVSTVDRSHPATAHMPETWTWEEEWYNFRSLSLNIHVLLSVDESTYRGGENGSEHPIAWLQEYEGSRVFYTGIGHQRAAFTDVRIRRHLLGGIQYAARKA